MARVKEALKTRADGRGSFRASRCSVCLTCPDVSAGGGDAGRTWSIVMAGGSRSVLQPPSLLLQHPDDAQVRPGDEKRPRSRKSERRFTSFLKAGTE